MVYTVGLVMEVTTVCGRNISYFDYNKNPVFVVILKHKKFDSL